MTKIVTIASKIFFDDTCVTSRYIFFLLNNIFPIPFLILWFSIFCCVLSSFFIFIFYSPFLIYIIFILRNENEILKDVYIILIHPPPQSTLTHNLRHPFPNLKS